MVPAVWQATQAGFYSMNLHANDRIPFFFILGRPRSGTTLIRTLFDAHPNVKIPPEFPFIPLLARRFRNVKEWDARFICLVRDYRERLLYFQKKHPKRFILVSYEDFVADPVRRFRELTRFHCGEIRRYAWLRTTIQDLESFPLAKNQTYGIVCHVVVPAHGSQPLSSLRSDPVGIGKNCHAGSALYPVYVEKEKAGSGKIVDPSFRGRFGTDICTTLYCFSLKL
jgi:hypothetical protein